MAEMICFIFLTFYFRISRCLETSFLCIISSSLQINAQLGDNAQGPAWHHIIFMPRVEMFVVAVVCASKNILRALAYVGVGCAV
jgi:hypothetical protein